MQWNRSNTIGLAKASCCFCHGYGLGLFHKGAVLLCLSAIFRASMTRFRECVSKAEHTSSVSLEFCQGGKSSRRTYSRQQQTTGRAPAFGHPSFVRVKELGEDGRTISLPPSSSKMKDRV